MRPVSLKSALKRTLKDLNLYEIYRRQRALVLWERVCGREVAAVSRAEKLLGKTLFIEAKDHIWATELSHFKQQFIERYEKFLGKGIVRDIRFSAERGGKIKKKKTRGEYDINLVELTKKDVNEIEKMAADVHDEKLREAVKAFLENKFKYDRWLKKHGGVKCFGCGVMIEKGKTFCPHCAMELEDKNREALREIIEHNPWISYREASKNVTPLDIQTYYEVKEKMTEAVYGEIIDSLELIGKNKKSSVTSDVKCKILTLAMLCSGKKPADLKDDILRKILPPRMYDFLAGK